MKHSSASDLHNKAPSSIALEDHYGIVYVYLATASGIYILSGDSYSFLDFPYRTSFPSFYSFLSLSTTSMADLTILSPLPLVPLHPSLQASRPSLFRNYVPGASTSRVNLSSSPEQIPSSKSRTRARNSSSDTETTEGTDGSHGRNDDHDEGRGEGDTAQDQVESPTSYTYNDTRNPTPTWDIG